MASYLLGPGVAAAPRKRLVRTHADPNRYEVVDSVEFDSDVHCLRIRNEEGGGYLFATVNGAELPEPGQPGTLRTGAGIGADVTVFPVPVGEHTIVRVRRVQGPFDGTGDYVAQGHALMESNLIHGKPTAYSVEAQLAAEDDWPPLPEPV
jgi:hypothetical protein